MHREVEQTRLTSRQDALTAKTFMFIDVQTFLGSKLRTTSWYIFVYILEAQTAKRPTIKLLQKRNAPQD